MKNRWIMLFQVIFFIVLVCLTGGFLYLEYEKSSQEELVYEELSSYGIGLETAAMVIKDSLIISGGKEGLLCIDTHTLEEYSLDGAPDFRYVRSLFIDDKNRLWIGHEDGLTLWADNKWTSYTEGDGLPHNRIHDICQDESGHIYVGTYHGAFRIDQVIPKKDSYEIVIGRLFYTEDGLTDNLVNVIFSDDRERIWFGSYLSIKGGLNFIYDDFKRSGESESTSNTVITQSFFPDDGLPHSHVTAMLQDTKGVIWVGTGLMDRGGVCYIKPGDDILEISGTLSMEDGLAGVKVRSLFQDSREIIWIGSEYDGIALFMYKESIKDGHVLDILDVENGLVNNEVKVALEDREGNVWLGTRAGITRVDKAFFINK